MSSLFNQLINTSIKYTPGGATCSQGIVKCFPRVTQAVGLHCSCMLPKQAGETLRKHVITKPSEQVAAPDCPTNFNLTDLSPLGDLLPRRLRSLSLEPLSLSLRSRSRERLRRRRSPRSFDRLRDLIWEGDRKLMRSS